MHLMYFTEQPMAAYDESEGRKYGATALTFSNKHFDPKAGSELYNNYIEQYKKCEEVGIDGIMLNEHHNAPFCMQAKTNMFAAILAAVTKKVKIVILGNPLPLAENPIRLAEELAMIDMISKGRLVSGFVRGGGQELAPRGRAHRRTGSQAGSMLVDGPAGVDQALERLRRGLEPLAGVLHLRSKVGR